MQSEGPLQKKAFESRYWIRLLHKTKHLIDNKAKELITNINEIIKMLTSSINTAKKNLKS